MVSQFKDWLDQPLARWKCVMGWIFAFSVFVGLIALMGGPTDSDSSISIYSTWAIAHGSFSCAYPHANTLAAPLYPLLSGGVAALLRIGAHTPFPTAAMLGPHCSNAFLSISTWSFQSHAWSRTLQIGDMSWLAVMGGMVAVLRTTDRGRRGWEPFTLALVAVSLPVSMPLVEDFHPQDILAFGLVLGAIACARRDTWSWAGVLIGFAFTSQQFALLPAVVLFVVAPKGRHLRFVSTAVATVAAVGIPMVALTSGRAVRAVLVGTGLSPSLGTTWLVETGLRSPIVYDVAPILATFAITYWLVRRLGASVLAAEILVSLVAVSLCLRLVFALNLWGYYFMPLSVALIVLDVVNGRIRGATIAWLAMVTLVFNPVIFYQFANGRTYDFGPFQAIQILFLVVALSIIVWDAAHRRFRTYLVAWFVLAVVAFAVDGWMYGPPHKPFPLWLWQFVLIATALVLAGGPIRAKLRNYDGQSVAVQFTKL
jgi:Glycosyltransferase family 87